MVGGEGGEGGVSYCDDEACHGDGEEGQEFEEHQDIACSCSDFGGETVEERDEGESEEGNAFVDPDDADAGVWEGVGGGGHGKESTDDVFAKNNRDDGCRARFQDEDGTPSEEEAEEVAEDFGKVDLGAAVQGDCAA